MDPRARRFRRSLLAWYAGAARPLAWRRTDDPYRILVSEVMLQQTQAARVEPIFEAFCRRFPTVVALADATPADVLAAWAGLGYNRRAVALHRAARVLVERHGGVVPDDLDALRALPGVGDYTARAVLAFAFGRPAAPVDTNVARVLLRAVAGRTLPPRAVQALADELLPHDTPGSWSSALMDLGAGYCTARAPRCADCPVAPACAWRGRPGSDDPARRAGAARPTPTVPFTASDRYHRGRLVAALRCGGVPHDSLAAAAQLEDTERLARVIDGLVADGLVERTAEGLRLPTAVQRRHAPGGTE